MSAMQKFLATAAACRRLWATVNLAAADEYARRRSYADAADLLAAEARATGILLVPANRTASAAAGD